MTTRSTTRAVTRSTTRGTTSTVSGGPFAPATPFIATPSTETPVAGVAVTWSTNAGDLGTPVSYEWDFGDNTVPGSGATPSHTYNALGPYTATCVVTMDDDSTYTDTQVITPTAPTNSTAYDEHDELLTSPHTWDKYQLTTTDNFATAPDATTTAVKIDDGASAGTHQLYKSGLAYPAGLPFTLEVWMKDIDRQFGFLTILNVAGTKWVSASFDLQAGTVVDTDATGASWTLNDSGIESVGSGWYRCWIEATISADSVYSMVCPGDTGTIGTYGIASYTGSNKSFLAWHPTLITGPSYQLTARQDFTADVTDAISVPGGAKLAATAGIGWSGMIGTDIDSSNFNTCTVNESSATVLDKIPRFCGGWFNLESASGDAILAGCTQNAAFVAGWKIEGGNLTANGATIMAVPVNTWIWLSFSSGYNTATTIKTRCSYRYADGSLTVASSANSGTVDDSAISRVVGSFSGNGNTGAIGRVSMASSYVLAHIDDPAYPGELVPPQTANYIYRVDPVDGDDANDGVTGAWQTITRVNAMLKGNANDGYPWQGIVSKPSSATPGTGAHLIIDTSVEPLDVGTAGLRIFVPGLWVKAATGETWIEYKPYVDIDSGDWTATGGHADTYQVACTFASAQLFCKTDAELYKYVADLTALDSETNKAFTWAANVLYFKSATNPASNGKAYLHTRIRQGSIGDAVVNVGSYAVRVSDSKIWYTAYNNNGSYCIGDITGFSGECLVEHFDLRYTDKHAICWVIDATNSTFTANNGVVEQGLSQPLTSYMNTGSGNEHTWSNITMTKDWLRANMPEGDYGFGAFYSHGGGNGRFDFVAIVDCDFGLCDVQFEVAAVEARITNSTIGTLVNQRDLVATGSTLYLAASVFEWSIQADFTLTNCIVRTADAPMIRDLVAANVIACDYNTYYFPAAAIFAQDFDAGLGGGPADYTFAQWQALGYDTHSTRLDP